MSNSACKLLTIREAAELVGEKPWTLRRRLKRLHEQSGGQLLQSYAPDGARVGVWRLHPDDLVTVMRNQRASHQDQQEHETAVAVIRVEELEAKLVALRNAHKRTRAELREVIARLAKLEGWAKAIDLKKRRRLSRCE